MPRQLGGSSAVAVLLTVVSLVLITGTSSGLAGDDYSLIEDELPGRPRRCETIKISACMNVGYNTTSMPNLVGMELQSEAEYQLDTFKLLVQYGCSSQLQFFLCSLFAPMCTPQVTQPIGPCRPLCETVRGRCAPVLAGIGYPWPPLLNCSRLPSENNANHMCMEGPGETAPPPAAIHPPVPRNPPSTTTIHCTQYAYPQLYRYINATGRCAPLCFAHISFTSADKEFASVWMAIWSVVCFAVTLFTVLSFVVDAGAFRYPERALVHMSLCFCGVATGYLVRLAAGSSVVTCHADPELGVHVTITEGALHPSCAMVFILLYYFSSAAAVWWVTLCIAWLLTAWRKLTHEQILQHSSIFHVVAWGLPALQTITCLVLRRVDADELTGICFAGQQDVDTLVRWVLVPQFIYLATGSVVVLVVFACLWRTRSVLQSQGLPTTRVDITVARVGIVAVLYMVPATCLVGSTFYEYVKKPLWLHDPAVRPNMEVFMLKVFMTMAAGIMGGLFLANGRVLASWRRLGYRITSAKAPLPPYLQTAHLMQQHQQQQQQLHHHQQEQHHSFKKVHQPKQNCQQQQYHHHHHHHHHLQPPPPNIPTQTHNTNNSSSSRHGKQQQQQQQQQQQPGCCQQQNQLQNQQLIVAPRAKNPGSETCV